MNHFGPMIAADLRKRRLKPHTTWHLDEVYLKIDGRMVYLWPPVDAEGEVLDVLIQSKRKEACRAETDVQDGSGSRARVQPRNFFPHTPPSTIPSTSNAISSQPKRTARFALRR